MSLEIIVESHATTSDNEAGIATGWLPGTLSELGRRQAVELGSRHRGGIGLAAVLTSDLRRAVQTAQLAFPDRTGAPPLRQDPRLRECDYGQLNGAPAADIAAVRTQHLDEPFPGGQSYRQVLDATRTLLDDLAEEWEGVDATLLFITHSANRWACESLLGGADLATLLLNPPPWQPGWRYSVPRHRH